MLGEELGSAGSGARRWVLDPLDGTEWFARGIPVWGTLIALEDADGPLVAVVSAPALRRRWWAERGHGAYRDGRRIEVSRVTAVEDAFVAHANLHLGFEIDAEPLLRAARLSGGWESFLGLMLCAEGAVDAAFAPRGFLWDLLAGAADRRGGRRALHRLRRPPHGRRPRRRGRQPGAARRRARAASERARRAASEPARRGRRAARRAARRRASGTSRPARPRSSGARASRARPPPGRPPRRRAPAPPRPRAGRRPSSGARARAASERTSGSTRSKLAGTGSPCRTTCATR